MIECECRRRSTRQRRLRRRNRAARSRCCRSSPRLRATTPTPSRRARSTSAKLGLMRGCGEIDRSRATARHQPRPAEAASECMRLPRLGKSHNSGCGELCGRHYFRWDNRPQGYGDTSRRAVDAVAVDAQRRGDLGPGPAKAWGGHGRGVLGEGHQHPGGSGACISRVNRNGHTFEYISGEDPTLGATLVVPVVDGIQQNVMAITKHYLVNNQEDHRTTVNELVDEVTLMELYGKPFAAAAARTGYMCAYNLAAVRVREPAHARRHAQRVVQLLGLRRERLGRIASTSPAAFRSRCRGPSSSPRRRSTTPSQRADRPVED